jgi:hypothetical protein
MTACFYCTVGQPRSVLPSCCVHCCPRLPAAPLLEPSRLAHEEAVPAAPSPMKQTQQASKQSE